MLIPDGRTVPVKETLCVSTTDCAEEEDDEDSFSEGMVVEPLPQATSRRLSVRRGGAGEGAWV